MIQEFESAEFIATLLTKEKENYVKYSISKLSKIVEKIEKSNPEIRINFGTQSFQRMCSQCENITFTKYYIIVNNIDSLITKTFIAYNKPSLKTRKIFLDNI